MVMDFHFPQLFHITYFFCLMENLLIFLSIFFSFSQMLSFCLLNLEISILLWEDNSGKLDFYTMKLMLENWKNTWNIRQSF
jgi:hypothetical protein